MPSPSNKQENQRASTESSSSNEQERTLREHVEKALREYGPYSDTEIDDVMEKLDQVGVRSTRAFTVIKLSCLDGTGMTPVTAGILMKTFGETKTPGGDKKDKLQEDIKTVLAILESVTSIISALSNTVSASFNAHSTRVNMMKKP